MGKKKWLSAVTCFVFVLAGLLPLYSATASSNGKERWRFETGDGVYSSPAIGSDGTVYVGSLDNNLYAVDKKGIEKWHFETEDKVVSSPTIGVDGTIYVGSWDNRLYAINPENGKKKWQFVTGDKVVSSPAVGEDGTVYVGSGDNRLYAINPENGKKRWQFVAEDKVVSSPVIGADGTIYVGSWDKRLYAIKPNGTEKWAFEAGDAVYSSPVIGADGTIYVGSVGGNLYAINPANGKEKWHFTTGEQVLAAAAVGADGTIYVGSFDKKLYAINPKNGKEKWHFAAGGAVQSRPVIAEDGTIYFGSFDKNLYAIRSSGVEKWRFPTGDQIGSSPAIGPDGAIYIGSMDKNLYAIGMVSISGVSLNKTKLTVEVGQSETLLVTVTPEEASIQDIVWSSSANRIATVDNSGKVKGIAPGTATITATAEDGGYLKQCVLTVVEATNASPEADFSLSDIDRHWAKNAIIEAVSKGIVYGYPDGTFKPDRTVTRAEFAVLLMNALKPAGKGEALIFKDKDAIGPWAEKQIAQCVELGIINGYSDGTFRPNKTITHAEMIVMVVRAANLPIGDDITTAGFLDEASIPPYARSQVAVAKLYGITNYIADNRFRPNEASTRAESVTAIINMLKVKR
ncbi:outer membrane protein assembly factor BamB family protein [Brevibacillus reuszeri]|uniref:outer membrane protein assembly factor BamB family protein n=1 Tax=Brevibacillus reuszeri TaxID=54915 RepID=UPI00289E7A8E|nr:PQQ-binding-like beta-propeller repeat protein [Brevibacillus reuszeri]